jgi:PAP_fibrillin
MQTSESVSGADFENSSTGDDIDADAREVDTETIKSELLNLINGTNRGLDATKDVKRSVLELVKQLDNKGESFAATENPELLCGTWRLIFTNALDILSLSLLPFVRIGPIFQNVEAGDTAGEYTIYNVVDLTPPFEPVLNAFDLLGPSVTRIRVTAKGTTSSFAPQKLDIKFVRSAVEGVSLLGFDVSDLPVLATGISNSAVGYVDTIFIDNDIRIARAPPTRNAPNDSNYFVLLRE